MMYYFIVNPKARSNRGMRIWDIIEKELKKEEVSYEVYFTEYPHHATDLARVVTEGGDYLTLVAIGGDGTVNEVLNGVVRLEQITFGYIPAGSSNDFIRDLHLPVKPEQALHNILHPKYYKNIHLGQITCGDTIRRFAVSSGIGFDAAICHEALKSRFKNFLNKLKLGKLTYMGIAFHQIVLCKPELMTLHIDGCKTFQFPRTLFLAAMNCSYEGGGFRFCPKANPEREALDFCIVHGLSKWKVPIPLLAAKKGHHTRFKGVDTLRCRKARIHVDTPLAVHIDGESCGFQTDLDIECSKETLRIIAGC
ncbi:diacylglycerol/lipid kinase family protein [Diplocloster agilis]|uniref:diacylglycerol/lipid kinase family protein n=1 Tax=Diplocloster agilis TaxID=2850323 RepID=UPI0008211532|nr:diacylglycerol kinase family protein [Suonthocola fibrivorans]MCU6732612.1 diacylglycerol kinase family lipid kinase [Suonthocola fibrivorans]SCI54751.1 Putative lipid kinase YtlR [uncultured Clostridium sp.]